MDEAALTFVAKLDDQASEATRHLRGTMDALGGPVDPITAAIRMEAEGLSQTLTAVEGTNDAIVTDSKKSGDQAGSGLGTGIASGLGGVKGKLKTAGTAAGAAVGAALVLSLTQAMEFEDANAKLTAQLGLTEDESARIGKAAGDLYSQNWGDSIGGVNDAVAAVYSSIDGMATAGGDKLEDLTTKAIAFADTFDTDVNRAVQVVGQTVRTGLVKDADEGFDLLTKASQSVPANVREDLLDALDEYGPFFQSLGMSGQDAFGALVAGADKGMYGIDKTGDALKEFTIRATDMSTTTQAALGSIQGIDVTTIDKNSKEGKATLARLAKSSQDLSNDFLAGGDTAKGAFRDTVKGLLAIEDPATRSNAALALFGTPLEDLSVSEIPSFLSGLIDGSKTMDGFKGSAQEMADTVGGTTSGGFAALKRELLEMAAGWGAKLLPIIQQFMPTIRALAPIIIGLVGAFAAVAAIVRVVTVAQAAYNLVLLANPMVLLAVAIAALVAGLVVFFTQTKIGQRIVQAVWGGIKAAMGAVVSWWTGTAWPAMRKAFEAIGTVVKTIAGLVMRYVNMWRTIIAAAVSAIATVIRTYVNIWRTIITGVVSAIKGILSWFGTLGGKFAGWFAAIGSAIREKVTAITGAVGDIVTKIKDKLTAVVDTVKTIGGNIVQGVVDGITGAVHKVVDAAKKIVDNITGPVKKLLGIHSPSKVFHGFGVDTVKGFTNGLDDSRDKAAQSVAALVAKVKDTAGIGKADKSALVQYVKRQGKALDAAWRTYDKSAAKLAAANEKLAGMKADRSNMRDQVASSLMGGVDLGSVVAKDDAGNTVKGGTKFAAVSGYVKGLVAKFRAFAGSLKALGAAGLPSSLVQMVAGLGPDDGQEVARSLLTGSKSQLATLKQDWSGLEAWSKSAGSAVASVTFDTGIAAQEGLVKGLTSDTRKAQRAAERLAANLAKWIRRELGIHSPSRVFRDIGSQTVDGLAVGLEDVRPVQDAMGALSQAVVDGYDPASLTAPTITANLNPQAVSLRGNTTTTQVVDVRIAHVVTSPDGSVRQYTAQQLAEILARDPRASATIEGAVRKTVQQRDARTLSASA